MPKKLVTPANPQIIVPSLNRRQILGGLGALALPILGCSGDEGDGGPVGTSGAPGFPGGSGPGGSGVGGGAAGSGGPLGVSGGGTTGSGLGGSPGAGGKLTVGGSGPAPAGAPSGGSGNIAGSGITGGTSPGGASGASGAAGGASGGSAGSAGSAGGPMTGGGDFLPINWAGTPTCAQSKTDGAGQGPFFIHDMEKQDDVSLFRQDLRGQYNPDAEPGIEFQVHLKFVKLGSCDAPVPDVEVYIWNTDAQGYYSGFGLKGTSTEQKPDAPYRGVPNMNNLQNTDRFERGYQVTNAEGIVSFKTIYPGFYNGRDVHTHLVVLKKGSMARATRGTYTGGDHIFTTQLYYNEQFTAEEVHKKFEPYKRRTTIPEWAGAIKGDEAGSSGIKFQPTMNPGNIVTGTMILVIDPGKSVGGTGGG